MRFPPVPHSSSRIGELTVLAMAASQAPAWFLLLWRGDVAALVLCGILEAACGIGIVCAVRRQFGDETRDPQANVEQERRSHEIASRHAEAMSHQQQRVEEALAVLRDGVDGRGGEVLRATETLHKTADELARAAMRVISETTAASVAAEDVRRELSLVVASGHEFLETITRIGTHAASSATMGVEAFSKAEATTANIDDLLTASRRIGEMTELVASIARQTNLLALNATIEAARAGEHGRGFAVVAGEVKSLANESARAAAAIAELAGTIYGSTERTIGSIQAISETIRALNEATTAIAGAVEERVRAAASMTGGVDQAATNIDHVASSIGRIEAAVDETVQGAGFVRVGASDVATQMTAIQDHLTRSAGALGAIAAPGSLSCCPDPKGGDGATAVSRRPAFANA